MEDPHVFNNDNIFVPLDGPFNCPYGMEFCFAHEPDYDQCIYCVKDAINYLKGILKRIRYKKERCGEYPSGKEKNNGW